MQTEVFHDQHSTNSPGVSGFTKFWDYVRAITSPYWYPTDPKGRSFSEVIRSWGMLIFLILLIIGLVGVTALNSFVDRYLIDVIVQQKDVSLFVQTLSIYGIGLLLITLLTGFTKFVRKKLPLIGING